MIENTKAGQSVMQKKYASVMRIKAIVITPDRSILFLIGLTKPINKLGALKPPALLCIVCNTNEQGMVVVHCIHAIQA